MDESGLPPSRILRAARIIRAELGDLLAPAKAMEVEASLRALLGVAEVERDLSALADLEDRILEVLAAQEPTRRRASEVLPTTEGERSIGTFEPLPGSGEPVDADWYGCPAGDYDWPVFDVDEPVPECPKHHVRLVPISSHQHVD
jgi:hypothetical protein